MSEAALVPKLRFSEFSDEWEAGYLNEFIDSLDAGVSVNSTDRQAESNEKCILKTSCVSSGVFKLKENKVVLDDDEIQRLKEPLQSNTIIISRMNTPALVGANAIVTYSMSNVFLPDRLWAAKINKNYSGKWLGILMSSTKFRAALSARATGTSASMKNITKGDVLSLKITYPAKPEQQKIAAFLTAVDNKIEQLSKKQELLGEYKKGLMQKIFSQAIRFKADDGSEFPDWEEKKLGDLIAEISDGGTPPTSNKGNFGGGINWVVIDDIRDEIRITKETLTETGLSNSSSKLWKPETIILSTGATIGRVGIAKIYTTTKQGVCGIVVNQFTSNLFLKYWFIFNINLLKRFSQGSSIKEVRPPTLIKFDISTPSLPEQTKIANFLSSIDSKIEQVGKQLDESKQFKKALLQQMFV
jgi:type I restriction enzyme S subunit